MSVSSDATGDMFVYCAVVRARSFSRAAKSLGASRSMVSKKVSRLEQRLGTRLLNRSTRALSLTEAGELLFRRYSEIVEAIERADQEVRVARRSYAGIVRLAAPEVWCQIGMPLISDLQRRLPDIEIRLSVVDEDLDLIESGYDAAIHVGELTSSNLICRKILSSPYAICATPAYFEEHGRPENPDALTGHNCLCRVSAPGAEGAMWEFREAARKAERVRVSGTFSADNDLVLLRACLNGAGVCRLPRALVDEHLVAGRLESVLGRYCLVSCDFFVILPHRDMSEKVRVVVDFLSRRYGEQMES